MTNYIEILQKKKLITPPKWLGENTMFLGLTGSVAYGASSDTSDMDIYGFAIPPKEDVFPHLSGNIHGFGTQPNPFQQYQQHHVFDQHANGGKGQEYDITVFSIVKFFDLTMGMNPNMVDVLFLPRRCVLHSTNTYERIRENRHMFLSKLAWSKFKGYAYSQMSKMKNGSNRSNPKRAESIEKFGFDLKFAYHIVRLMLEVEQILTIGDLDLERDREIYKSIRRGEWSLEKIEGFFTSKEKSLEDAYHKSSLPWKPDEEQIKRLLLECLEDHYGSLDKVIKLETTSDKLIGELETLISKYK